MIDVVTLTIRFLYLVWLVLKPPVLVTSRLSHPCSFDEFCFFRAAWGVAQSMSGRKATYTQANRANGLRIRCFTRRSF